jgi:hypothetical protein
MKTNSDSFLISKNFIYFLSVFLVLISIVLSMQGRWSIDKARFEDADCYTRLNRVVQFEIL